MYTTFCKLLLTNIVPKCIRRALCSRELPLDNTFEIENEIEGQFVESSLSCYEFLNQISFFNVWIWNSSLSPETSCLDNCNNNKKLVISKHMRHELINKKIISTQTIPIKLLKYYKHKHNRVWWKNSLVQKN